MSYIGNEPSQTLASPTSQYFNGTGSQTVFTLNRLVNVSEDLEVFVNNIQQEPGVGKSYTATGSTLTFDAAPSAGTNNVYVVYRGLAEVTTRLEHDPNSAVSATTGTFNGLNVSGTSTFGTPSGDTRFNFDGANQYRAVFKNGGTIGGQIGAGGADDLRFSNAAGATVATIKNGSLGIGTSSPTLDGSLAGLSVNGSGTVLHVNDGDGATLKLTDPATGANRGLGITLQGTSAAISNCESGELRFGTGNTERMRIDASGRVTTPSQPSFFARNTSGSHSNGAVILFNQIYHNNGSHYNAANGRFTAPVAGYYFFYSTVCWNRTTATIDFYCDIKHNGNVAVRMYTDKAGGANVHPQQTGQYGSYLNANDYIEVQAIAGGPIINNGNHCSFGGYLYA